VRLRKGYRFKTRLYHPPDLGFRYTHRSIWRRLYGNSWHPQIRPARPPSLSKDSRFPVAQLPPGGACRRALSDRTGHSRPVGGAVFAATSPADLRSPKSMSEAKVQLVLAALRNGKTPNGICVGRLDGRCTSSFAHCGSGMRQFSVDR
jgi:hypothetical protein